MYAKHEGFELFTSQDLGWGDLLHYLGRGFMRGHRQMAWGGEPKRGKPIPCLTGRVIITKHPIRDYQCTLVGIKDSNYWEI